VGFAVPKQGIKDHEGVFGNCIHQERIISTLVKDLCAWGKEKPRRPLHFRVISVHGRHMKNKPPLPYKPALKSIARALRKQTTFPERLLWSRLRRRQLDVRFLRQRPIGDYVVDFYCPTHKLAIEIDGHSHEGRFEADRHRQQALERMGVLFLRFTNDEVLRDLEGVMARIHIGLEERTGNASTDEDRPSDRV